MKSIFSCKASRRLLAKGLSIVAVAVLAFAALELVIVQPALAGIACCTNSAKTDCLCDPYSQCNVLKNGKLYSFQVVGKTCWNTSICGDISTIRSTITCESISEETFLDPTSLQRTGLLNCSVTQSDHNGSGVCQLNLSYSRPAGLTQCTNNGNGTSTLTYSGFSSQVTGGSAQNRLTVTGTLQCGTSLNSVLPAFCQGDENCALNLGIADVGGLSSQLFPADPDADLVDGQVLSFSQTVAGSNCGAESPVVELGQLHTRYCNGGTFNGAAVDCTFGTGKNLKLLAGGGTAEPAILFDVAFSPTTLNLTCGPNNNDTWHFTIQGNGHLDLVAGVTDPLRSIDPSTLAVEGVAGLNVTCDPVNTANNSQTCHVRACQANGPDLGPIVKANRNPDGTADLTVTGALNNGTRIFGEDLRHNTSGQ